MTEPTVITVEQPAPQPPVIVTTPEPTSEPLILDFLQTEINEVEDDVKALREAVASDSRDTAERLAIVETVLDHILDRVADIVEAASEESQAEPVDDTPAPSLPKVSDKEKRKRDKAPKPSNARRQLLLGRTGGIFSKNEGTYP